MIVSDKLAIEFNTILFAHALMSLILVSFSAYIYFKAKKSALLFSYFSVVGMILLWMISKILKTVSPTLELRWFFILTQYFAIDCLSVCLLCFAYIYVKHYTPSKLKILQWSILPTLSFIAIATNPIHMTFYSYFDIYKDQFGLTFYAAQSIHYLYLIAGIKMLSHGFTRQALFAGKKSLGFLFSVFVLLPLMTNIYYILFKMDLFPWIFPFPVFDFSPIAASLSLILFMIPIVKFRFFDLAPISLERLYNLIPHGIVFVDIIGRFYGGNQTFYSMLQLNKTAVTQTQICSNANVWGKQSAGQFSEFLSDTLVKETVLPLVDGRYIKATKAVLKNGHLRLSLYDITDLNQNRMRISEQNKELEDVNQLLDRMAQNTKELAIARTKAKMAQNVHDILGHSLTVVIGTAELASTDEAQDAKQKLHQIEELLSSSLNDLRNTFSGKEFKWGQTTLTKAIDHLKNDNILVDITIHGRTYELDSAQTESVYRLCQEAITNAIRHGKARTIYLILRYHPHELEIYAVDNGEGCKNIEKSYGLRGIEQRLEELSGRVSFISDGESGFTIHARLPRVPAEPS